MGPLEWSSGVSAATCRTTETTKVLAVPLSVWQEWWEQSQDLATGLKHILNVRISTLAKALLAERALQDRTFLDEIDQLQPSLRTTQLCDLEALNELNATDAGISWFIPSVSHLVPDLQPYSADGLRTVFRLH